MALAISLWSSAPGARAETGEVENGGLRARHFEIVRASGPIVVDALLDEPAWADALRFDLPYEWTPGDNTTPPVRTEFLVTYDDQNLYAAWIAKDPSPSAIRAHLMDRDEIGTLVQDDHVVLMLDTYNDERRGFQFRINPLGVQADAIFSETEGDEDWSFDLIWKSAGRLTADGYQVEIAIPFDQLRFARHEGAQTWGFDVARSYPRSVRYRIAAHPVDRNNSCVLCQIDKVSGFKDLEPGRNLEITPTLTGNRTEVRDDFPTGDFMTQVEDLDPGLSVRWGITPNVSLNATINPDFSQVEADVAQLQVNNRFALFFPEKRPFFLEGVDFFRTPINAVFTRTVVAPDWGGKLTATFGDHGVGVFVAQDTVNSLLFPTNQGSSGTLLDEDVTTSVLRYRRDVGSGSTVGAIYTGRQGDDYANDVLGVDAFLRFGASHTLSIQALRSDTRYPDALASSFEQPHGSFSGDALAVDYSLNSRHWIASAEYNVFDPGFRADTGFVRRVDFEQLEGVLIRRWFGEDEDWWTRANLGLFTRRVEDRSGQLTDQTFDLFANFSGPMQSFVEVSLEQNREFFDGVLYDDMNAFQIFGSLQPSGALRLRFFVSSGDSIDLANGQLADELRIEPGIQLKLGRHVNMRLDHTLQRLSVPGGRLFEANLTQLRWVYNLNVRTFVRVISQRFDLVRDPTLFAASVEPRERSLFTQVLFSYKLSAQTVVFLGYSDNRLGDEDLSLTQADRTLFFKLGYAFTL